VTREEAAQLWEQHGEYVKRLLCKWISAPPPGLGRLSRHEVDDLHQETFLKLLEPGARFDGRSKATTWLYSVAHNAVADYQRRQGRMRQRHRRWGAETACQLQPLDCATPARRSGDGHDDHDAGEPIELPWSERPPADELADANE
jgi:RNA polymerase sigma factor (sigma-70 family)